MEGYFAVGALELASRVGFGRVWVSCESERGISVKQQLYQENPRAFPPLLLHH